MSLVLEPPGWKPPKATASKADNVWKLQDDTPLTTIGQGDAALKGASVVIRDARPDLSKGTGVAVELPDGTHLLPMEPTHSPSARDLVWVSGPSGCGKSTVLRMIAARYRAIWPGRLIALVTALDRGDVSLPTTSTSKLEPEAIAGAPRPSSGGGKHAAGGGAPHGSGGGLRESSSRTGTAAGASGDGTKARKAAAAAIKDDIGIRRINVESLVSAPMPLSELEDTLLLIDDVEDLPKEQAAAVQELANRVANQGRHWRISMVYSQHLLTNYKATRNLLGECHHYVIYPTGTSKAQMRTLLRSYAGLDDDQLKELRRLPSRWVAVKRTYPPTVVYDRGAYLLNANDESDDDAVGGRSSSRAGSKATKRRRTGIPGSGHRLLN